MIEHENANLKTHKIRLFQRFYCIDVKIVKLSSRMFSKSSTRIIMKIGLPRCENIDLYSIPWQVYQSWRALFHLHVYIIYVLCIIFTLSSKHHGSIL